MKSAEKVMIRRKAKRIERAGQRLSYIKNDIENSKFIPKSEKDYLLLQIEQLSLYLQNDDLKENSYNYDNANNNSAGQSKGKELSVLNDAMTEDVMKFIESARIARFEPVCAITTMMVTHGIEKLSETELIAEALELSDWLREQATFRPTS